MGTFGISSAGYWWARLAAAIVRAIHYAGGHSRKAWLLLFADDGKLTMPLSMWRQLLPIMLALLVVLDIPVKWEKVKGGFQYQWTGYWSNLLLFTVGISEGRQRWVIERLTKILNNEDVESDFDSGFGKAVLRVRCYGIRQAFPRTLIQPGGVDPIQIWEESRHEEPPSIREVHFAPLEVPVERASKRKLPEGETMRQYGSGAFPNGCESRG